MSGTTVTPTIEQLVEALDTAGGELDDEGRRIALTTYHLLTHRLPVDHARIAAALDLPVATVDRRFEEWPGVFRDDEGSIVGFWGLALQPLDPEYHLTAGDGRTVGYAWCAWDTLFLPTLLGLTLGVEATDGQTGRPVRLSVAPDGVRSAEPEGARVSILVPEGPWDADILTSFCHKVLFFTDDASAGEWIARHPEPLVTLSVDDAFEVGRRWTRNRYGEALDR